MIVRSLFVATLRCQAWNTWPEKAAFEVSSLRIDLGDGNLWPAKLGIVSYINRTVPTSYTSEESDIGPLLWTGKVPGLYTVLNTVLIAPEDNVEVAWEHRHPHRGEIDIAVAFKFTMEPDDTAKDALRGLLFSVMSLLNLQLPDFLTPTAPMQVRRVDEVNSQFASDTLLACRARKQLTTEDLQKQVSKIATVAFGLNRARLRIALELYGSHFHEPQTRTRFLLLVIAIEALAEPAQRNDVVLKMIEQWGSALETEKVLYDAVSEEYAALEALGRELIYKRETTIRSQVRQLFRGVAQAPGDSTDTVPRRALAVYDARSTLVHEEVLLPGVLERNEREALELVEMALLSLSTSGVSNT